MISTKIPRYIQVEDASVRHWAFKGLEGASGGSLQGDRRWRGSPASTAICADSRQTSEKVVEKDKEEEKSQKQGRSSQPFSAARAETWRKDGDRGLQSAWYCGAAGPQVLDFSVVFWHQNVAFYVLVFHTHLKALPTATTVWMIDSILCLYYHIFTAFPTPTGYWT